MRAHPHLNRRRQSRVDDHIHEGTPAPPGSFPCPLATTRCRPFTFDARRQGRCVATRVLDRLGFVGSVLSENVTTSRTCRLSNATPLRLRELTAQNLASLDQVLTFLERNDIRLYRIS